VLLEPVMSIGIECPQQFQGSVVGDLTSRRGIIVSTDMVEGTAMINAEVPLAETFGYATDLRSMTQGQGIFTLEPCAYRRTPMSIQEDIIAEKKKEQLVGAR
jgi:elongation factor G